MLVGAFCVATLLTGERNDGVPRAVVVQMLGTGESGDSGFGGAAGTIDPGFGGAGGITTAASGFGGAGGTTTAFGRGGAGGTATVRVAGGAAVVVAEVVGTDSSCNFGMAQQ